MPHEVGTGKLIGGVRKTTIGDTPAIIVKTNANGVTMKEVRRAVKFLP